MYSGFSGDRRASSSERSTAFFRDASSNSLTLAEPTRLPYTELTDRLMVLAAPAVETALLAYRILPSSLPPRDATHSSAVEKLSTLVNIACASSLLKIAITLNISCCVDYIISVEPCGGAAV